MTTTRGTGTARDRQKRLQGRRVIPLSRQQRKDRDANRAKVVAAEYLADLKAERDTPEGAILSNEGRDSCPGCGTTTDAHTGMPPNSGIDCTYEWDGEKYVDTGEAGTPSESGDD